MYHCNYDITLHITLHHDSLSIKDQLLIWSIVFMIVKPFSLKWKQNFKLSKTKVSILSNVYKAIVRVLEPLFWYQGIFMNAHSISALRAAYRANQWSSMNFHLEDAVAVNSIPSDRVWYTFWSLCCSHLYGSTEEQWENNFELCPKVGYIATKLFLWSPSEAKKDTNWPVVHLQ